MLPPVSAAPPAAPPLDLRPYRLGTAQACGLRLCSDLSFVQHTACASEPRPPPGLPSVLASPPTERYQQRPEAFARLQARLEASGACVDVFWDARPSLLGLPGSLAYTLPEHALQVQFDGLLWVARGPVRPGAPLPEVLGHCQRQHPRLPRTRALLAQPGGHAPTHWLFVAEPLALQGRTGRTRALLSADLPHLLALDPAYPGEGLAVGAPEALLHGAAQDLEWTLRLQTLLEPDADSPGNSWGVQPRRVAETQRLCSALREMQFLGLGLPPRGETPDEAHAELGGRFAPLSAEWAPGSGVRLWLGGPARPFTPLLERVERRLHALAQRRNRLPRLHT